jgi:hypothetical protein
MVSQTEVLEYARERRRQRPQISEAEMRAVLEAKFIRGVDPLARAAARGMTLGAVHSLTDWLEGLGRVLWGWFRMYVLGDAKGVKDVIEGVLIVRFREGPTPARPAPHG